MSAFLRLIDVVLVFQNEEVLLVSECEADHILELLWSIRGNANTCSFTFMNLAFAFDGLVRGGNHPKFHDAHLVLGCGLDRKLPLLSIIACHVYNGETMVIKSLQNEVEPTFRYLLCPLTQRAVTLSNYVNSRGNGHKWMRSFLHDLCCQMDLKECFDG